MVSYAQVPGVNDSSGGGNGSLGLGLDVICKDVVTRKSVGFVGNEKDKVIQGKSIISKVNCTKTSIRILHWKRFASNERVNGNKGRRERINHQYHL